MDDSKVDAFLDEVAAAEVVTAGQEGYPEATLMPFVRDGDRLLLHMARANPHWRSIAPGMPALAIVLGAQAYVSPSWYASKAEHGRVVPTWDYSAVHIYGRATVHDDEGWARRVVGLLTSKHERSRPHPWSVDDAPAEYVERQLKAIVGVELRVERLEAKAKLSLDRSSDDFRGVVEGLEREGGPRGTEVARSMRAVRSP